MLKHKKIYITILLLLMLLIPFTYNTLAETDDSRLEEAEKTCDAEMLVEKYKLNIEKVANTGNQYRIYVNGKKNAVGEAEFRLTEVTSGYLHGDMTTLPSIKYGQDLYVNIDSAAATGEAGNLVAVGITLDKEIDGCLAGSDEVYENDVAGKEYIGTFHVELKITDSAPIRNNIYVGNNTIPNPHVGAGKICSNFISGNYESSQFNSTTVIKKDDFDAYNYNIVNQAGKTFYQEMIPYCFQSTIQGDSAYGDDELVAMIGNAISIWKAYNTPTSTGTLSFSQSFESIRNNAIASGNATGTFDSPVPKGTALNKENNCSPNQTDTATKNYYSAQLVDTQTVKYQYNYAPGGEDSETKKVCDKICEEAVQVEYGPPVASKAGLCFEYTVKVSSYVKCTADINPDAKPKISNGSYCTPNVECRSTKGTIRKKPQAGPNEEFDQCIQSCDGGKYTKSCSLKCYKEVYKNSNNLKINYENLKENATQKMGYSVSECLRDNPDGCYTRNGSTINWREINQRRAFEPELLGRFYHEIGYDMGLITSHQYVADARGFSRAVYETGDCTDICEWQDTCGYNEYLNPNTGAKDNQRNMKLYNSAVSACKAAATCSKNTATFTVAVKYDTQDGDDPYVVNKVYYPYTSSSQHKQNPIENSSEYSSIAKDTFTNGNGSKNDVTTIINYDGCYADSGSGRWYLTEWGFPGTYINNKTGEISFQAPSDLSGWYYENKKFCIPLNAKTVNENWWNWKILNNGVGTAPSVSSKTGTSDGYNIEAITNGFGYFGWNITTNCFYAVNNKPTGIGATAGKENETVGYIIRAVDRNNLFPNSSTAVADEQRRKVGFNWTEKATILGQKNNEYKVNPSELKKEIEENADTIYSEEPDYQFKLTPKDLNTLRKYNDKYKYTEWLGKVSEINGVMSYKSNIFRSEGEEPNVLAGETIKKIGTPGVNNE